MFKLRPRDAREALDLLSRDPVESVYLRSVLLRAGLDNHGDRQPGFFGFREDGALSGVLLKSPLVVPFAVSGAAARAFGSDLARSAVEIRNIVGRRQTVAALWQAMDAGRPEPRLLRDRQPVYRLDRQSFVAQEPAPLRRARTSDLNSVVVAGSAMMREEVLEDPLSERPEDYMRYVRDRVMRGDEFVWLDGEGLCFKCSVGSRTPDVAQLEGVYTPPHRRGQGLATRGLAACCALLLRDVPTLCLYVNDFNVAAIKLYERLGFHHVFDYQSIFMARTVNRV